MPIYGPLYQSAIWDQGHSWSFSDESLAHVRLGFRVAFSAPGQVIGMRYLRHPDQHGAMIGTIQEDNDGPFLAWAMQKPPADLSTPADPAWHDVYFHPRAHVDASTVYECGVYFDQAYYGYEPGGAVPGIAVGDIVIPADGSLPGGARSSLFSYQRILGAWDGGSSALYAVDVIFLPDA